MVKGRIGGEPLGRCEYSKWGGVCTLEVYPLRVDELAEEWEESFRDRRWVSPKDAAALLRPRALGAMVLRLGKRLKKKGKA